MNYAQAKKKLSSYDWDVEMKEFKKLYGPIYEEMVATAGAAVADKFDLDDPFVKKRMTTYMAERVKGISQTTRDHLNDMLRTRLEDGDVDIRELAGDLRDSFAFSPARANMIARTEPSIAYNHGELFGFRQSDYEEVEVVDGDSDPECAEADGQIWDIDEALDNELEHPNCTRRFLPHRSEEAEKILKVGPSRKMMVDRAREARAAREKILKGGVGSGIRGHHTDREHDADKVARALASHKPSTKAKQQIARANEARLSGMLKGSTHTPDNKPVDVLWQVGKILHGVEVKTFVDNRNDKITMHKGSLKRKLKWENKEPNRMLHTVLFDNRHGRDDMYYQRSAGSFRRGTMTPIRSVSQLQSLIKRSK